MNTYKVVLRYMYLILLVACLSLLVNSCKKGIVENDELTTKSEKIDDLISRYADYGKFNGTILVAENGEVLYKKGVGMANMEWDIPNKPDTKFRIASITKQFTAMLIVQLASENKVDLHEPISTYLPDYPKENGDRITLHHLLTHTSGIPEFDLYIKYRDIERDRYRPEELLNIFADQPLQFEPGTKFEYTNPGYVVLGVIIEKITGKPYEEVLQDQIFTPLKMTNSGYDRHYTVIKNRASGYSNGYSRGEFYNTNFVDMSIPYAAGSIYSTVEDLHLWDRALYCDTLVSETYRDLLFNKHIPARGRHYGYGWFIGEMPLGNTNEQVQTIGHGGGINGFNTLITRIPSNESLIVVLNNVERVPLREITTAINGILHDKSFDPKISVAYSMKEVLEKDGEPNALEYYKEVNRSADHYHDLHEMNKVGYELFFSDKIIEAAFVFKLNIEAYPDRWEVYDSYAESLLKLEDSINSIRNYKKSLELNPNNNQAKKVLKTLEK